MRKYATYKDSGIEWIGEIPEHWDCWKIAHAYGKLGSGTTPESGNPIYYDGGSINWLNTGDLNNGILESCNNKVTEKALEDYSALKKYLAGSLAIAMYGATIGKTSLIEFETTTNQACCLFTQSSIIKNKFLFYWFLANKEHVINLSKGGGQPNISQDILKRLIVPCSSYDEQTQITDYLDRKTAQIDELVAKKEKLITLLQEERTAIINQAVTQGLDPTVPMKDSGIEWLGEIPAHWEITRIKMGCRIIDCKHVTPTYVNDGIPVVSTGNVKPGRISLYSARKVTQEDFEILSEGGRRPTLSDIIYSRNASVGAAALVRTEHEFCLGQDICIIRSDENQEFIEAILNSEFILTQLESVLVGSTFRRINIQQIKEFVMALPKHDEQNAIVQHIRTQTQRVDNILKRVKREIKLLKEYKTALISEVVTGKVDVREEVLV